MQKMNGKTGTKKARKGGGEDVAESAWIKKKLELLQILLEEECDERRKETELLRMNMQLLGQEFKLLRFEILKITEGIVITGEDDNRTHSMFPTPSPAEKSSAPLHLQQLNHKSLMETPKKRNLANSSPLRIQQTRPKKRKSGKVNHPKRKSRRKRAKKIQTMPSKHQSTAPQSQPTALAELKSWLDDSVSHDDNSLADDITNTILAPSIPKSAEYPEAIDFAFEEEVNEMIQRKCSKDSASRAPIQTDHTIIDNDNKDGNKNHKSNSTPRPRCPMREKCTLSNEAHWNKYSHSLSRDGVAMQKLSLIHISEPTRPY
eukprot:TRINITY_DN3321_c0_g1_i3.p1 TRINITY_DN3321_c0_g1~~TRINITY_DN3321_c0_g1_i3.p1  ORF type:complete len:317 (-),score=43.20 TRINITY_DN3321_c0_g1_i3:18-968(-)